MGIQNLKEFVYIKLLSLLNCYILSDKNEPILVECRVIYLFTWCTAMGIGNKTAIKSYPKTHLKCHRMMRDNLNRLVLTGLLDLVS